MLEASASISNEDQDKICRLQPIKGILEMLLKYNIMGRFDRFCQSCGMPMGKDPGQGGTNADGSKSTEYCSYCYDKGAFRDNFTNPKQMIEFVKEQLKKQGIGPIRRWFYTLHIGQLRRWKTA